MCKMLDKGISLSDRKLKAIIQSFKMNFLKEDHLWLFGSRVDFNRKGGDIDLLLI